MDVQQTAIDQSRARELYQEYKAHRHYSTPIDDEIRKTYKLIAQGKVVIQAIESVKQAGLNAEGFPKLALSRATELACILRTSPNGSCTMSGETWRRGRGRHDDRIAFPAGTFPFPVIERRWSHGVERVTKDGRAQVPLIPVHLRPRQALDSYHILFEAEWKPIPPQDPLLLRRIGKADLWLVVAAWDLTPVERAALATRISVQ